MYNGNISFDFVRIEEICNELRNMSYKLDDIHGGMIRELQKLSDMEIGSIQECMTNAANKSEGLAEELLRHVKTLERISDNYAETEKAQVRHVSSLAGNLTAASKVKDVMISGSYIDPLDSGRLYSSHIVLNEDWLNDASFEWR